MRNILIILIVLLIAFCADCQDSILVPRFVLQKVASQLDSFDVLKLKEVQYIRYVEDCATLVSEQDKIILYQDTALKNKDRQIDMMAEIDHQNQINSKASQDYINVLEKQNKGHKIRNKVILIGGCVLTVGLTTALLITLLQ